MRGDEILLLGIGIQPPWQLVDQHLDTTTQPHELHLRVQAEGSARARARGYRNAETFMTMIYLIGSPAGSIPKSI